MQQFSETRFEGGT